MFRPRPKTAFVHFSVSRLDASAREGRKQRVMALVAEGFPLPQGRIFELLRRLGDPVVDLGGVSELIRSEPRLQGQIEGLLGSSPFEEYRGTLAVDRAVVLLGSERLRILILGCALADFAGRCLGPEALRHFWHHGILASLLCERIARQTRPEDTEKAYLGGLLHDIGRLPLLIVGREQENAGVPVPASVHDQPSRERAYFGVDHCEVGRWIALSGNFPSWMTEVIAHHHDPAAASEDFTLISLVAAADRHCQTPHPGTLGRGARDLRESGGEGLLARRPPGLVNDDRAIQSQFLSNSGLRSVFPQFGSC
jgi:HD-like signal output (HDOD) protein